MKIIRVGKLPRIRFEDVRPELVGTEITCKTCGCVFEPETGDFLKPIYDLSPSRNIIGYVVVCPGCSGYHRV